MTRFNRFSQILLACVFVMSFATTAGAYIDAGTGSFLTQFLLAGILGGAFVAKNAWSNFKGRILGRNKADQ